jgi:hypothetical protein
VKALIARSAQGVAEGAKLVDEAAETIAQVAKGSSGVAEVIGEIARASAEQSTGVEEIARAIQQLEGMTQQNAALVEQTGAAAQSFEEQARRLADAVGAFKLDRSEERERAIELVRRGIAHIAAVGSENAFRDFEQRGGAFYQGDHYLWVSDLEGVVRSHAASPTSRDKSFADLQDNNGKYFIREVLRIARERGKGWVDYQWYNPVSKKVEPKSSYFERAGKLILFCGIYRVEAQARAAAPAGRGRLLTAS